MNQWDFSVGTFALDISVHQFLLSNWNEAGITWNTTGSNPGPTPGVDYVSAALDQKTFFGSETEISFQVFLGKLHSL